MSTCLPESWQAGALKRHVMGSEWGERAPEVGHVYSPRNLAAGAKCFPAEVSPATPAT